MKFGLLTLMDFHPELQNEAVYLKDTLSLFELADQLGYSTAWIGEEHFYTFGVCPNPQLLLAALAPRTSRIRLGTAISLLPFENPLRKAEDFALLDVISGGRVNFGVGRGSIPKHFEGFAINARESRGRYDESLRMIRNAWLQKSAAHEGKYWSVPDVSISPRPVQQPHPPIWRATVSAESFLQAADAGDNVFLIPWVATSEKEMGARFDDYRDRAAECGHEDLQSTAVYMLYIDESHQAALERGREESRRYAELITKHTTSQSGDTRFAPGSAAFEHADYILSITDNLEERAIVGTPDTCIRRIREIDEQLGGVSEFAFYLHAGARSTEAARRSIELFAEEVMPAFQRISA